MMVALQDSELEKYIQELKRGVFARWGSGCVQRLIKGERDRAVGVLGNEI